MSFLIFGSFCVSFFKMKIEVFNECDFLLLVVYAFSSVLKQILDTAFPSITIFVSSPEPKAHR